ncbi:cytochrome P450 [Thozetella sp. PMI_491]|nr:cytochrome P450 [Thozetella sp. PMI_491]
MQFYLIGLAILALTLFRLRNVGKRPKGLPPGPPTVPILGNLHQMPRKNVHLQFKKWADEYGPIYSLILGTKIMVVLSSDQAVKDLLDKRSAIYSSRPEMYLASNIASGGLRVALMQYGDTWRMIRKLFHSFLNVNAAKSYAPYQDLESKQMLVGLLDEPENWISHIRRYTNSLTTQIIFGFRTTSIDDPKMKQLYDEFEVFSAVAGGQTAALLDVFPTLRLLPKFLIPAYGHARRLFESQRELYASYWRDVKRKMKDGTIKPCFCVGLAKAQPVEGFSDDLAGFIAGSALEGGSDTTAPEIVAFVQAMLLYPEVQKAAQREVDRVCGGRLPVIEDQEALQYIRACAKESIRWFPTAVLGFPHSVIQDDEYEGYRIPKDATVMFNVWAINRNPSRHPNPEMFDPTRFINDRQTSAEAAANPDVSKRDHFTFGAGRRVCQGMHIADRSMFLSLSRLVWAFQFDKAVDEHGDQITPLSDDIIEGAVSYLRPFPLKIGPRSKEREHMVRKSWEDCGEFLDEDKQWKEVPSGMMFEKYDPELEARD